MSNLQQLLALYKSETGKNAYRGKKTTPTDVFDKWNKKKLREGKTNIYWDKTKGFNKLTGRVNTFKLKKDGKPTKASLQKLKRKNEIASSKYVALGDDLVKMTPESLKNPLPFLEQQFNTNAPSLNQLRNKGFVFLKQIPPSRKIEMTLTISYDLTYMDKKERKRTFEKTILASREDITDEFINDLIEEEFGGGLIAPLETDNVVVDYRTSKGSKLKRGKMKMFDSSPLDICNLFNEIIVVEGGDCVATYCKKLWKNRVKNSKKLTNEIETLRTIDNCAEFCERRKIKMIAFDITGKKIRTVMEKETNKNFANLVFICYNNHLYPIKNKVLKKPWIENIELNYINEPGKVHKLFLKHLENKNMVKVISLKQDTKEVEAFIDDEVLTFENEDHLICKDILDKFGILDQLKWNTRITNIGRIIETLYVKENIDSYWTDHAKYKKQGFNYRSNNNMTGEEYITMDKNKAYSNESAQLEYLISVDFKTATFVEVDELKDEDIVEYYIYLVEVESSNIFFDKTNVYTGKHILIAIKYGLVNGVNFKIKEYVETEKHPNYIRKMIYDLYEKLPKKIAKDIVNRYIGGFERYSNVKQFAKASHICNKDEYDIFEGETIPIKCKNNNYHIALENVKYANVNNRKPIAIQIKDACRIRMFEFCMENKISNEDVLQVKTDSITFRKRNDIYKKFITTDLHGWKMESFKDIIKTNQYNLEKLCLNFKPVESNDLINKMIYKKNSCIRGLAGNGKTKFIITKLIPQIIKDKEEYLITTPSHDACDEYRKEKLNVSVIQYKTIIPDIKHLIVDEIGMVGTNDWNFIIRCIYLGINVYVFGDFDQLPPVKGKKITLNFLHSVFESFVSFTNNYRNNFEVSYYKSLINSNNDKYLQNEVKKHSEDKWDKDTQLICCLNKTRHKHNKIICDKLNIPYIMNEKEELIISDKVKEGVPIICKGNELRQMGIYNKRLLTIKGTIMKISVEDSLKKLTTKKLHFVVGDNIGTDYKLQYTTIKKYFDYAYCRTLHSIQGKSIEKIKFCEEDLPLLDNTKAYTFISRKKQIVKNKNKKDYKLIL